MKNISRDLYAETALALQNAIGNADFFNGSVDVPENDANCTLVLTAIVYRRTETAPDGTRRPIRDIVPIWWEFRTPDNRGGELNDFDFAELKPYLVENE